MEKLQKKLEKGGKLLVGLLNLEYNKMVTMEEVFYAVCICTLPVWRADAGALA